MAESTAHEVSNTSTIVVAGMENPALIHFAAALKGAGFDVVLIEESPRKTKSVKQSQSFLSRVAESLYWRTLGRRHSAARRRLSAAFEDPPSGVEGIKRLRVSSLNSEDGREALNSLEPDLMITLGPRILKPTTFEIPRLGTWNIHSGLLPDYRGTLAELWTQLDRRFGDIGVTLHQMSKGLDQGDIIQIVSVPGEVRESPYDARRRTMLALIAELPSIVRKFLAGEIVPRAQDESRARVYRTPNWKHWLRRDLQCVFSRRRS